VFFSFPFFQASLECYLTASFFLNPSATCGWGDGRVFPPYLPIKDASFLFPFFLFVDVPDRCAPQLRPPYPGRVTSTAGPFLFPSLKYVSRLLREQRFRSHPFQPNRGVDMSGVPSLSSLPRPRTILTFFLVFYRRGMCRGSPCSLPFSFEDFRRFLESLSFLFFSPLLFFFSLSGQLFISSCRR